LETQGQAHCIVGYSTLCSVVTAHFDKTDIALRKRH